MILNSGGSNHAVVCVGRGLGLSCCRSAPEHVGGMQDGIEQAEVQEEDPFRLLLADLEVDTRNVICDLMEEGENGGRC